MRAKLVEEVRWGLYVWKMPDGRWVGDAEGNFLNIPAIKGDLEKIKKLTDAVRHYGITEGSPHFLSGNRRVNEEEYEEQKMRMKWGLLPDREDVAALAEEAEWQKKYGR